MVGFLAACQAASETAVSPSRSTPEPALTPTHNAPNAASTDCDNPVPDDRRFGLPSWPNTNFCLHSVPYAEIRSGGVGRDRIPALDAPQFETEAQADVWLADVEPVLALALNGEARAYPLQLLVWHEIVNDVVAGQPVAVTYCPLCNAGLVFDRTLHGQVLDFGTTGNLRQADLIMYDRQTESWWQQFTGEGIVGEMTGQRLTMLPASIVSWREFKAQFPVGRVLSEDTGYDRYYGETPYINYDSLTNPRASYFDGDIDDRLPTKMRVLALQLGDEAVAYPYSLLAEVEVINDRRSGQELVVFWRSGTASALYKQIIAESRDVGSAAAFSRLLNGGTLTFTAQEGSFVDLETSSTWNLFGTAVAGPLAGEQLTPLPGHEFLWFAWAAFQPDTAVYQLP